MKNFVFYALQEIREDIIRMYLKKECGKLWTELTFYALFLLLLLLLI